MLDNLGLGEFFFLALLALIFFGPERLPGIGARLGRWIRSLTQYSSAFLNEWRDEALAVQDAVQEVKGIRDEIVAARAEIAGTLDTARTEMGDAVSGATRDVQEQVKRSTEILPEAGTPPAPPAEEGTGTDAAIAKTQAILEGLGAGRRAAPDSSAQRSEPAADGELESQTAGSMPALPRALDGGQTAGSMPALPHALDGGQTAGSMLALPRALDGAQIETLRGQVDLLRREMRALQAELAQVRARIEARRARTRGEHESVAEREKALAVASPAVEPVGKVGH